MIKETPLSEPVQEAIKRIGSYLKREKPYVFKIDEIVREVGNGLVQLTMRVYNGKVTDILEHKITKRINLNQKQGGSKTESHG